MMQICRRLYSTVVRKRFYKSVNVVSSGDGRFEVCLDGKKIKTPRGNFIRIRSEPLALAVAQEWDSQKEIIKFHAMHLTGLSVTAIDNPLNHTEKSLVDEVMKYFRNDTLLYWNEETENLGKLQRKHWGDVIDWVKKHYDIDFQPTSTLDGPNVPDKAVSKLTSHIASYNFWSLIGYQYAVDSLKSLLLTLATVQCHLNIEEAVKLSVLEQEFQTNQWGRVEWSHDFEYHELCCRLASAVFFVGTCRQSISDVKNDSVQI